MKVSLVHVSFSDAVSVVVDVVTERTRDEKRVYGSSTKPCAIVKCEYS
jgi:hypothetical protein